MPDSEPLRRILQQVESAKAELDAYGPSCIDWYRRAVAVVNTFVPWLVQEAPGLRLYVEEVLSSPVQLREAWVAIHPRIDAPAEVARIHELLDHEQILLEFIAGDTVSIVVTRHLLAHFPGGALAGNSKSDYPDLFLKTSDYSRLPVRTRLTKEIGAAVRGLKRRPVRVPDGLEIKTSRNNASIDCHYPHVGLHLIVAFARTEGRTVIDDVLAAFLCRADYRITKRKTEATTVKASFGRTQFISLL